MKKYIAGTSILFLGLISMVFVGYGAIVYAQSDASACVTLTNNLARRSGDVNSGGEVSALQDFLQSQNYLNTNTTGYFGLLTFSATKSFQTANGIISTGYVGPITRAKIAELSCKEEKISLQNNSSSTSAPAITQTPAQSQIVSFSGGGSSSASISAGNDTSTSSTNASASIVTATVDLKINGSDGPINLDYTTSNNPSNLPTLSWTSTNLGTGKCTLIQKGDLTSGLATSNTAMKNGVISNVKINCTSTVVGVTDIVTDTVVVNFGATQPVTPTSISISPSIPASLAIGGTKQLTANVLDQNGVAIASPTLIWTSSDPLVATVNNLGLVTAVTAGGAMISVSSGGTRSDGLNIIVSGPSTVAPTVTLGTPSYYPSNGTAYLSWSATNITRCDSLKNGVVDVKIYDSPLTSLSNQSLIVYYTNSGDYSIKCTGPGGTTTSNIVTVVDQTPPPAIQADPESN